MKTRRDVLVGIGVIGTTALAGCGDVLGSDGPTDAVEGYITAANDRDVDAVNAVLHPESASYPIEEGDFPDDEIKINEIEETSIEEFVQWRSGRSGGELKGEELDSAVEDQRQGIREQVEAIGADDFAFVFLSITQGSEDNETYLLVVEDDGEWLVYI
ncbi:MAG: hypothetical protein V5A36_04765 [Natronomonas sp.]